MSYDFDVAILGAGPGGVAAAKTLARNGKKVALIEQHLVGGECLHVGCIPSKVFLYSSELYEKFVRAAIFGIETGEIRFQFSALLERKKRVVEMIHRGLTAGLEKLSVQIVKGRGALSDLYTVAVQDVSGAVNTLRAEKIILATGSRPAMLAGVSPSNRILTNRTIFDLSQLPKSLLIIGGGATGCEFASFFSAVGTSVTLVERGERILPHEDYDISSELHRLLTRRGVKILTNTSLSSVRDLGEIVQCDDLSFEYVLIAVGRRLNHDFGDFEKLDITHTDRSIAVNEFLQTSQPHIYAIGDMAGKSLLAYTAEREGELASQHILGKILDKSDILMDYSAIPNTIFTHPEIASVGLSEEAARLSGKDVITGKALYAANSRALIEGDRDGFVKVVGDGDSGKILGVHIIGKHATLMIDKATVAISESLTARRFLKSLHGHPVMSEIFKDAVQDFERQL